MPVYLLLALVLAYTPVDVKSIINASKKDITLFTFFICISSFLLFAVPII